MKKENLKKSLSLAKIFIIFFAIFCAFNFKVEAAEIQEIDIVSINDFHGALKTYENKDNEGKVIGKTSAALLSGKIDELKSANPSGTVIVSAGDMFQGTPMSNVLFGKPVVEMMNYLGVEVMALGNHEFDWGMDKLNNIKETGKFDIISCNIYDKKTGERANFTKPYKIVEKNGVKIGFIGVTTQETAYTTLPKNVESFEFRDPAIEINKVVDEVKSNGADIIVVVGHIDAMQDKNTKEITGVAADTAKVLDNSKVNAIVSGHSHQIISGKVNDISIVQASSSAKALGKLKLMYNKEIKKVESVESEVVDTYNNFNTIKPSTDIEKLVKDTENEVMPMFNSKIGKSKSDLKRDYNKESNIGNWVADVVKNEGKAEIGFQNAGGLRADVPAGDLKVEDIFNIIPFDNTISTMKLTGNQIKEILEQSITLEKGMLQVSGLTFKYDNNLEKGNRVYEIKVNGSLIDMQKEYKVAVNDFIADGGDKFITFKNGKENKCTFTLVRDALLSDIKKLTSENKELDASVEGRIKEETRVQAEPEVKSQLEEEVKPQSEEEVSKSETVNTKKYVVVTASKLNVRDNPSINGQIKGIVSNGDLLQVNEEVNDWLKILYNGKDYYVYKEYTAEVAEVKDKIVTVTAGSGLNLRKSVNTNSAIIKTIEYNTPLNVVGDAGNWFKVNYNGTEGYVYKKYTE